MHADEAMGDRDILATARLDDATAASVATTLQALATVHHIEHLRLGIRGTL
ncbi:hypothetical protein ACWELB_22320 [Streptomyces asiaticus]